VDGIFPSFLNTKDCFTTQVLVAVRDFMLFDRHGTIKEFNYRLDGSC
jgi:hypothetical protein